MVVKMLSLDPPIIAVDNFLSDGEIATVLELGTPLLEPSEIQVGDGGGRARSIRNSSTAFLGEVRCAFLN
jgi:hypothetical protein